MRSLTAEEIRASFANLDPQDAEHIPLPGLHEVVWEDREYLGWRDPSLPSRGYLVHDAADGPVGIVLRVADGSHGRGIPAMCSLCHATQPAAQVSLWSAPRAGRAGRDGSSIGTYICDDLGCSHIIRMLPPSSPWAIGTGDLLQARATGLLERVMSFSANVLATR
ncbi:MAG TPA: FBP domain-containing protein [Microbacteriaceae bacterium]|nr:FBP domain-containing protein [Microbacteriaceae bacterium]